MTRVLAQAPTSQNRQEKSWSESTWPTQHLGIGLVALAMTTTGVPAQPVQDSQIICERMTGMWLNDEHVLNYVSSGMLPIPNDIASLAVTPPVDAVSPPHNTAKSVRDLHVESGLTWEQLARLFGVSRRAVHHWASGGRMNAMNEEQLGEITDVVGKLPAGSPAERRSLILATPTEGPSVFEKLKSQRPASEILQVSAFSPDQLIG